MTNIKFFFFVSFALAVQAFILLKIASLLREVRDEARLQRPANPFTFTTSYSPILMTDAGEEKT